MSNDPFWTFFFEIFEAMPRQGPGDLESTRRALQRLPDLSPDQRILDVGCGTGTQTLDLARLTSAQIVAVDNHPPFIATLEARASAAGLGERITAQVGDMKDLRFPDGAFDVVWSEGAIFIIGFSEGLAEWRRLLKPGGHLVVSEFCWFRDDPPPELVEMHFDGVPAAANVEARRAAVAANGYRLLDEFVLPAVGWWENFYVPQGKTLAAFRKKHAGNPEALEVADRCQREIELYEAYADYFGYVFFVMQCDDPLR